MARPSKAVVEYFPLVCKWGDSIKYIEDTYGNDGYVCWVKLLQKLGRTEYHYFDFQDIKQRKIFCAEIRLNENLIKQIFDELAEFECIDKELWEQEIIFSENFVKSVKDAYRNRTINPLYKKDIVGLLTSKNRFCGVSDVRNPQSKVKESKVNKNKELLLEEEEQTAEQFLELAKNFHGEYSNVYLDEKNSQKLMALVLSEKVIKTLIDDLSSNIEKGKADRYDETLPNAHFEILKSYWEYRRKYPDKFRNKNEDTNTSKGDGYSL